MQVNSFLQTKIEYLKGVGAAKAELLQKEFNIFTFNDLLYYFPYRHIDRSKTYQISQLDDTMHYIQLKGTISNLKTIGQGAGARLVANFTDGTGSIELIWFQGQKWIRESLLAGKTYIVFGKLSEFNRTFSMVHPSMEDPNQVNEKLYVKMMPLYNASEKAKKRGVDTKYLMRLTNTLLTDARLQIDENLPDYLVAKHQLMSRSQAMIQIHFPDSFPLLHAAEQRLKFEELFFNQLRILRYKLKRHTVFNGIKIAKIGDLFNGFYSNQLPFELTNAQKRVLKEIRVDMGSGKQMNRLVQGDVGSGKTVVALMSMLMAIDNGYQATLMAPTEILANQHFETIKTLLGNMPIRVELLTGSVTKKNRRPIHEGLLNGEINILIGTHALIEDAVEFKNIGIAIIDEQHRFGVEQRAKLWKKNEHPPHILVMTATPIPRTLAMTLYGDLDTSMIDELPAGRKPIKTIHKYDNNRLEVYGFIRNEINKGRQVYIVYPLIAESEKLDFKNLAEGYESICREFPLPTYAVSMVHGKMKPAEKDFEMQRFVKGETNIMVATTVIEVGVNVPNASVMIIESAQRFGLSQLHQLRGRVGRGAEQSYCLLMTDFKISQDGKLRMKTMVETNDGFKISEVDLQLRGPGDMEGTMQSGVLDLRIASIIDDKEILEKARKEAQLILENDNNLQKPENAILKQYLMLYRKTNKWGAIS
ncbi:MAG: ATP-dependent DNA helicase RecG [Bacteroidia bacterium]|nr:ATP-dependent DNA helicase RecG [Bacteroidia bacterium]